MHPSNRWVVKYNDKELIKEVKLVYNPKEYKKFKTSKPLHTQNSVIKLLENDKEKRN